jgi:hypothetical protein
VLRATKGLFMPLPSYTFLQRDAALLQEPKKFVDALIATNRFYRDERNLIQFKVGSGEYLRIESRGTFRELILTGDIIKLSGDIDAQAFEVLWLWLIARKWTLPRLNPERAWNPPKPLDARRTSYAAPALNTPANLTPRIRR